MDHPDDGTRLDVSDIQRRFAEFSDAFGYLPLYSRLARGLSHDAEAASLLLAAQPGQERPVLLFAALHDLVLRRPDLPVAPWYATVVGRDAVATSDPWPAARLTLLDHADEVRRLIGSHTTQTNEVNRSTFAAAITALAASDLPGVPVTLLELGASAGLLLNVDRYRVEYVGGPVLGDPLSPVRCGGRLAGPLTAELPVIAARYGLDRHPVPADDDEALRWLKACLWPDVPGRAERFEAGVRLLRRNPPDLITGDFVEDLPHVLGELVDAHPTHHVVVFTSWALTYVARADRPAIPEALAQAATRVPVTWWTAEPHGAMPGLAAPPTDDTVLGVQRWRDAMTTGPVAVGTSHPHGDWVHLRR